MDIAAVGQLPASQEIGLTWIVQFDPFIAGAGAVPPRRLH
jgi:hypothetical protein